MFSLKIYPTSKYFTLTATAATVTFCISAPSTPQFFNPFVYRFQRGLSLKFCSVTSSTKDLFIISTREGGVPVLCQAPVICRLDTLQAWTTPFLLLLLPPASFYYSLPPAAATSCYLLLPPATSCYLLLPPATSCYLLLPPTAPYHHHTQPPSPSLLLAGLCASASLYSTGVPWYHGGGEGGIEEVCIYE